MKIKYLIGLCLIVLFLMSSAGVSASEDVNQTAESEILTAGTSDDAIGVSYDENVISGENRDWYVNASAADGGDGSDTAPYTNFKSVLDNTDLQDGDSVYFAGKEIYTGDGNVNLEIDKHLNLLKYGSGEAVFDAEHNSGIFRVTAICFNITGLTFQNGNSEYGGALYFINGICNSTINATFINNTATSYGGGASYFYSASNSNITGTYTHNTATNGNGGANSFYREVSNSNINGNYNHNTAKGSGGANYFNGEVSNSNITGTYVNNTATTTNGGANDFFRKVSDSNIAGTYINNSARFYGGANYFFKVEDSSITGTYVNNTAKHDGGANYFFNTVSNSNLTGTYVNNNASNSAIISFARDSNARIENAIFLNNKYDENTGVIYSAKNTSSISANNNWFGNNASNYEIEPVTTNIKMDSWLFLTGEGNQDRVKFFLMSYDGTATSEYDNTLLPDINLTLTATNTTLDKGYASLGEEKNHSYSVNADVTAQVENALHTVEIRVGEFDLLQQFINNASSSVINLTRNYTYNDLDTITEGVLINKNVTINGNGFTIDAKGKSRIFNITAGSINITDLTLKNGKAKNGGAIYFSNALSNSNINATFINNTSNGDDGGANFFGGELINATITGNYADNHAEKLGGANHFTEALVNVNIDGNFTNNTADFGGANCFVGALNNVNISGSFTNNHKVVMGGANRFCSALDNVVIAASFANNRANTAGANSFEGTLNNVWITGDFTNNRANRGSGGANYFEELKNVHLTGNYINNTASGYSGANLFHGALENVSLTGNFTNNQANKGSGGANYFFVKLKNVNLTGNYCGNSAHGFYAGVDIDRDYGYGGANCFASTIENVIVIGAYAYNWADGYGGAIYFNNSGVVSDCIFESNSADKGKGGAIYCYGGNAQVHDCIFINNSAGDYGAVHLSFGHTSVSRCVFVNNSASMGIVGQAFDSYGSAKINNNIFLNNNVSMNVIDFAAIGDLNTDYNWFGNNATDYKNKPASRYIQIDSWLFLNGTNNQNDIRFFLMSYNGTATSEYDNTLLPEVNLTITSTNGNVDKSIAKLGETVKFSPSESGMASATAQIENAALTIEFEMGDFNVLQELINNATSSVINLTCNYTYNQWDTMTEGVLIDKNVTINGNGFTIDAKGKTRIFNVTAGSINITGVTLKNGKAENGGAIYFSNAISNSNINATYINNTAENYGGANYFLHELTNVEIAGNYSYNRAEGTSRYDIGGGANCFLSELKYVTISGRFINNTAGNGFGGANEFYASLINVTITADFINNTAEKYGGANDFRYHLINVIISGDFINNSAYAGGANLFWYPLTNVAVTGNYVHNIANYTDYFGGGANYFGDDLNNVAITGNYTDNVAGYSGGANFFLFNLNNATITGNYINNKAINNYGGAIYFEKGGIISGCTFVNNSADNAVGGAVYFNSEGASSVYNSIFINNTAGNFSAVHLSSGVGNVSGCLFISNSAEFGVVGQAWDTYTQMNVNNNIFLNNDVTTDVIDFADFGNLNTDYNWFGNTQDNYTSEVPSQTSKIWLFLNATANPNPVPVTDSSKIVFKLYAYNTSGNVTDHNNNLLKPINLTITKTNGDVDKGIVNFDDTIVFYPASAGTGSVTASVENIAYTLKFNIKGNPELSVDAQDVYYSNNTVISLNYNSTATGKVNITLKGKKFDYTFEDLALNATVSLGKVSPDEYNVTVTYSGDDTFMNATAKGNLTVKPIVDISVTITPDKDEYFVGDVAVWTVTVHNAGNGTNATDVYVDNNFPGDYFEMINATTGNGTYYKHIGNEYLWKIGFMANGTDAVLKIFSRAKAARDDIPNFANAFAKEDDWNSTDNMVQKDVTVKKLNSTINVTGTVLDYGQTANITVTTEGATGIAANITTQNGDVIEAEVTGFTVMIPVLDAGNYTLNVTTKADANHNPATGTANITVNKALTEIILTNGTVNLEVNDAVPSGATLTPADAGNLTCTSSDSGVVKVEDDKIIAVGQGHANVTVSFEGNDNYAAAESRTIAVTVSLKDAGISVNNDTLDLFVGDSFNLVTATEPKDLTVNFTSGNSSVVSVDNNGNVIAVGEGTATITVKVGGDGVYAENSTEVTVTVSKIATEIALTNATVELKAHKSIGDLAALTPAEAGNLTYTSSDEDIVLVSEDGTIYALIKGTTTVTVSFAGNDKYKAAESRNITVTVTLNDASVSVENDTINLNIDDNYIINATANPRFLTVYYKSNNESVATVTEYGNIKAVGEGTAIITLTVGNNETYAINTTNITVNVSKIATEITLTNETIELKAHQSIGSQATLNPAEAGNLTYTSSNEEIVLVSEDGTIYARTKGTATVTVSFEGNNKYKAANKTITVNVTLNDASVRTENDTINLNIDDSYIINATANPRFLTVYYTSNNESIATVTEYGNIKAIGEGTATITLTVGNNETYAINSTNITVNVSKLPTEIITANETISLKVNDEIDSGVSLNPYDAGNLTYMISNSSIVKLLDNQITALSEGAATITYSFNGTDKYAPAESKTIKVTVSLNDASVSVNNSTLDLFVDDNFTIVAATLPKGLDVDFIPDNSGVVSVDENGFVTALKEGTASITVKVGGDGVYAENTTAVAVTVSKVPTEITVDSDSLDLFVGDETVIAAALAPADAGNVTFTSSDDSVVSVDAQGNVVAEGKGQAIITISFAGDDKYAAAENKTVTVTVGLNDASVTVDSDTLDLKVGETCAINATKNPDTILLDISYTSSDSSVATVDENGIVTAVGEGTAVITVEVGDDEIYAENSTAITVTVNKRDANVNVSMPENVTVGDNASVDVTLPSDATGNVTLKVDGEAIDTVPVSNGTANITIPSLNAGNHTAEIAYSGDDKYNPISETKDITVSKRDTAPEVAVDGSNVDVRLPGDAGGNVTVKVDDAVVSTVPLTDGTASVELPKLSAGNHTVEITYSGDDKYNPNTETATLSVDKDSTKLTADNVTATYKVKKYLTITLTDSSGSPIANATISVELKTPENYTTDANGQIKVKVSNMAPNTYTAKIAFNGDDNYTGSDTTAEVTVKKAASKITAKAKTFKSTTKTKKYTVTLKNSKGKALKNKRVYLKVNGKKYKAKTNSKGKATFKITKLNKAGKFKAKVTFKGNDYYKKSTKKVKLTVKSAFKTVSKGSKRHTIVKKIQRALKNNGYYLVYNGHYLKVDGIYWDCTKRAVKEFQNDKLLKVTGKVDEKTAKKLGII